MNSWSFFTRISWKQNKLGENYEKFNIFNKFD